MLIDALISALPRGFFLFVFPEIRRSICSLDSINAWVLDNQELRGLMMDDDPDMLQAELQHRCSVVVTVLQVLAIMFAIASTVVQILIAFKIRASSRSLCLGQQARMSRPRGRSGGGDISTQMVERRDILVCGPLRGHGIIWDRC